MKEKIEAYIKALIDFQEARLKIEILKLLIAIIVGNIIITLTLLWSPYLAIGYIIVLFVWFYPKAKKVLQKELNDTEQAIEKLHPFDGQEGAVKTLQGQLADFLEGLFGDRVLGKKFTGVKKFDPDEQNQQQDE